eukprot:UN28765
MRQTSKLEKRVLRLKKLLPDNDVEKVIQQNPKVLSVDNNKNLATQIRNIKTLFPETPIKDAVEKHAYILTSKMLEENEEFYRNNLPGLSVGYLFSKLPNLFTGDKQQDTMARVDILEQFFGNLSKVYNAIYQEPMLLVWRWHVFGRLLFLIDHPMAKGRTHE